MKETVIYSIAAVLILMTASILTAQSISLQQQADITTGASNISPRMTVGDVNNDGLPDLVVLNKGNVSANGPIAVFLNNGSGGFAAAINITDNTGLSPNAVLIRDLNGDGNPDLAIAADGLSTGINIRLGNGTGNFPTGTFIAERGSPAISSADFNSDGNWDLAICNNTNELRVLNGNGAGGFGAAATYTTGNACTDMQLADFNLDGKPDIVTAARLAASAIQVFLNNGSGVFNTPVNTVASGAYSLVTADFNRDCIPDLASVQYTGGTVYILLGNGAGGFTSSSVTVNNSPARMTVGDFNRDKKVDLAIRRNTLTAGANNLTILPGNGSGGFGAAFEMSIAVPANTVEMYLATIDINRDGKQDLIVGRQGGFVLFHNTSPLFTRSEADFDGDLRSDVSVFRPSTGFWYLDQSTKGFASAKWGLANDKLVPADFDADGKTDLAVWRADGYGDPNRSFFFILRSSDGTFQQEQFGRTGDDPSIAGDWDGDGRADAAVYRAGAAPGDPSSFFYRPSGTPGTDFIANGFGLNADEPLRGDFDGDGRLDLAVFRPSSAIWYILQSSNGAFAGKSWGLIDDKRVVGDYDGDGHSDLAVYRPSTNAWYILKSSDGSASYRQWGAPGDVLAPADYNGDGLTDPAVYRPSDNTWYPQPCAEYNTRWRRFGTSGDIAIPSAFVR